MNEIQTHRRGNAIRPVLWLLLIVSAAGNAGTSFAGTNVALHTAFGVVTLVCAIALIMNHRRGRR
jgi:membrane protein YdbS with pleckstrin-like domain